MKSVEVMSVECYYSTRVSARNGLKANRRASLAGRTPLPSAQEFHDAYARDSAALTCATTTVAAAAKTVSALRECTPLQCKLAKPGRKQSFSATRACMVGAVRGACPPLTPGSHHHHPRLRPSQPSRGLHVYFSGTVPRNALKKDGAGARVRE